MQAKAGPSPEAFLESRDAAVAAGLQWLDGGAEFSGIGDFAFRAFTDESPDTVLWFSPDGVLLYANGRWLRTYGFKAEDVIGRPYADIVVESERERQTARFAELRRVMTPESRILTDEFHASNQGWISVVYKGWFDSEGKLAVVTSVGRDYNAAYELAIANQRLEESNRDLQDFAYVASHDLQEPLRKISAFSDRLVTKYGANLDERAVDYLARIQSASARMQNLVEDLLTFSRVATHGSEAESTDLSTTIGGVLSDLEIAIDESSATVMVGELPTVQADPTQMRQLFQNLIGNALKFRSAQDACHVSVTAEKRMSRGSHDRSDREGWTISVADNGIGFDEKHLDKIFTVFQRLHGRSEYPGSGVGLSVCRRIVERHQGHLSATSEPGSGATFVIWLPDAPTGLDS